jgi:hypothetical protein
MYVCKELNKNANVAKLLFEIRQKMIQIGRI